MAGELARGQGVKAQAHQLTEKVTLAFQVLSSLPVPRLSLEMYACPGTMHNERN